MAKQIADVYKINTSLEQMLGGWLLSAYVIIDTAEKEAAFHSLVKVKRRFSPNFKTNLKRLLNVCIPC